MFYMFKFFYKYFSLGLYIYIYIYIGLIRRFFSAITFAFHGLHISMHMRLYRHMHAQVLGSTITVVFGYNMCLSSHIILYLLSRRMQIFLQKQKVMIILQDHIWIILPDHIWLYMTPPWHAGFLASRRRLPYSFLSWQL